MELIQLSGELIPFFSVFFITATFTGGITFSRTEERKSIMKT